MKTSISVPDDLWMKAKIMMPNAGASEIVQAAINAMVKDMFPSDEQLRNFWNEVSNNGK